MTPTDPSVERLKTLHVDCIYAAMTLEREQGASAGFDETHPAWVAATKADDAFFAALSEVLGDSQPVARLEHDTDEAGTLRVVYASPQRAEPASVQADESGWLIEMATMCGPRWFGFNYEPSKFSSWCHDSLKAVRFARQDDAERMRLYVIALSGLKGNNAYEKSITVTEHVWTALAAHPSTDQNNSG